MEQTGK